MNPFRAFTIYRRANKLVELFKRAIKSAEGVPMSKSLFASKTFWVNVLSAGLELSQVLPIPPGVLTLTTNVLNIALRVVTEQPVHVIPPK